MRLSESTLTITFLIIKIILNFVKCLSWAGWKRGGLSSKIYILRPRKYGEQRDIESGLSRDNKCNCIIF